MQYLMTQKNGHSEHDGCFDLDQVKVILYGKLALENRFYGIDSARKYRRENGLVNEEITEENIEQWARYYGFNIHCLDRSSWSKISELLEKEKNNQSGKKVKSQKVQYSIQIYQ